MSSALARSVEPGDLTRDQNQFRTLSREVCAMARTIGIHLIPYEREELPLFSRLSPERRTMILDSLQGQVRLGRMTLDFGSKLDDGKALVWSGLRELDLRPPDDLFDYLKDDQIIEIYSRHHTQIFRNFRFYALVSYTMEEFCSRPWFELYWREERVTQQMLQLANDVFTGRIRTVIPVTIGPHVLREVNSRLRAEVESNTTFMAPLFAKNGQVQAVLSVMEAKLLNYLALK